MGDMKTTSTTRMTDAPIWAEVGDRLRLADGTFAEIIRIGEVYGCPWQGCQRLRVIVRLP